MPGRKARYRFLDGVGHETAFVSRRPAFLSRLQKETLRHILAILANSASRWKCPLGCGIRGHWLN